MFSSGAVSFSCIALAQNWLFSELRAASRVVGASRHSEAVSLWTLVRVKLRSILNQVVDDNTSLRGLTFLVTVALGLVIGSKTDWNLFLDHLTTLVLEVEFTSSDRYSRRSSHLCVSLARDNHQKFYGALRLRSYH